MQVAVTRHSSLRRGPVRLNESPVRARAEQILDKILSTGKPRAVFVVKGKVRDYPHDGKHVPIAEAKHPEGFVGIYDEFVDIEDLMDDLVAMGAAA